jgi:periplasmic copper chaperone A
VESSKSRVQSKVRGVTIATAVAFACTVLNGQDRSVKASNGWVKLPAAGETEAMAFVTVENPGMYEVNVTSAKTDAAGKVELRDASQGGDARLKPVAFINVPSYGRVDMTAAGVHLMLVGLKRPLKEGDTVALTLSTDMDITLDVTAGVRGR